MWWPADAASPWYQPFVPPPPPRPPLARRERVKRAAAAAVTAAAAAARSLRCRRTARVAAAPARDAQVEDDSEFLSFSSSEQRSGDEASTSDANKSGNSGSGSDWESDASPRTDELPPTDRSAAGRPPTPEPEQAPGPSLLHTTACRAALACVAAARLLADGEEGGWALLPSIGIAAGLASAVVAGESSSPLFYLSGDVVEEAWLAARQCPTHGVTLSPSAASALGTAAGARASVHNDGHVSLCMDDPEWAAPIRASSDARDLHDGRDSISETVSPVPQCGIRAPAVSCPGAPCAAARPRGLRSPLTCPLLHCCRAAACGQPGTFPTNGVCGAQHHVGACAAGAGHQRCDARPIIACSPGERTCADCARAS